MFSSSLSISLCHSQQRLVQMAKSPAISDPRYAITSRCTQIFRVRIAFGDMSGLSKDSFDWTSRAVGFDVYLQRVNIYPIKHTRCPSLFTSLSLLLYPLAILVLSTPECRKCSITFYGADRVPRTARCSLILTTCKLGRRL